MNTIQSSPAVDEFEEAFPAASLEMIRRQAHEAYNHLRQTHAEAYRAADPLLLALVRLRGATWHNCRVCKSLRHVTGGERVLDESTAVKVEAYESSDLDDRHKVALGLADAYMTVPGLIDEELSARVRREFTGSQVTEMLLDIIAWTQQKPLVALALDIPPDPSALSSLDFDELGEPIIGATLS